MNISAMCTTFFFTNSWARFMGAGYFGVEKKDERMSMGRSRR